MNPYSLPAIEGKTTFWAINACVIWVFLRVFVGFGCEVLCIPLLFLLLLLLLLFLLLVILVNKHRDSPNLQLSLNRCDCTKKTRCSAPQDWSRRRPDTIYTQSLVGRNWHAQIPRLMQIASQKKISTWASAEPQRKTMENYGVEQTGPSWMVVRARPTALSVATVLTSVEHELVSKIRTQHDMFQ